MKDNKKHVCEYQVKLTLSELPAHLSAKNVEQVGRFGHVDNLHVAVLVLTSELVLRGEDARILIGELKVSLETSRRVLGTLSVVAVGQRHDETGSLHPLDLTRGDKLVNDTLGVVGEITELGLPHDEGVGRLERVTVLETESAELAERRVGNDELALVLAEVLERSVGVLRLLVVEDGMTLREGTTLNVLAGNSHVVALGDQRTESKGLSSREINVLSAVEDRLRAVLENSLQVVVYGEALGVRANNITNVLQCLLVNSGRVVRQDLSSKFLGGLEAVPGRRGPLLGSGLVVLGPVEAVLQHAPDPALVFLNVLLGEGAFTEELVDVDIDLGLVVLDALVHEGLGERGLIRLVMSVLSVADEINDDVVLELGAPVSGKLANEGDGLNIIGVDVEDGGVDGLGNIGTVGSRSGEAGIGGETNLVVDNQVDGTTSGEGRKRVESETLVDDTLGGKGSITVKEDRHGGLVVALVVIIVLDSTRLAQDNRVLGLQMGRVGDERELDTLARGGRALEVHTKMVLDVTRSLVGALGTGEFAEDGLVGLSDDVGQDVETTTMGHTNDNVLDAIVNATVDEGLHTGNKGFATFETESLIVGVLAGKECLEARTPDQAVENAALFVDGVLEGRGDLKALPKPITASAVGNVDELDTKGSRVDVLKGGDDFAESHLLAFRGLEAGQDTRAKLELGIKVLLGEVVELEGQFPGPDVTKALGRVSNTERIDVSLVVTTSLVRATQKLDLEVLHKIAVLAVSHALTRGQAGDTSSSAGDQVGRRDESLGDGHIAALHVSEVDLPRHVDARRVFFPLHIHLIDIARRASRKEVVTCVRGSGSRARGVSCFLAGHGHGSAGRNRSPCRRRSRWAQEATSGPAGDIPQHAERFWSSKLAIDMYEGIAATEKKVAYIV